MRTSRISPWAARLQRMKTPVFLALCLALAGCTKAASSEPTSSGTPPESAGAEAPPPAPAGKRQVIACTPESRGVEACTMDYTPVCGQHADGTPSKTYGNACGACTDANVVDY